MCDNFCLFWTYATLNGIPISPGGCQALTTLLRRIGREGKSFGCGYPPSIARSQRAEGGILGRRYRRREQSWGAALLKWQGLSLLLDGIGRIILDRNRHGLNRSQRMQIKAFICLLGILLLVILLFGKLILLLIHREDGESPHPHPDRKSVV